MKFTLLLGLVFLGSVNSFAKEAFPEKLTCVGEKLVSLKGSKQKYKKTLKLEFRYGSYYPEAASSSQYKGEMDIRVSAGNIGGEKSAHSYHELYSKKEIQFITLEGIRALWIDNEDIAYLPNGDTRIRIEGLGGEIEYRHWDKKRRKNLVDVKFSVAEMACKTESPMKQVAAAPGGPFPRNSASTSHVN